MQILPDNRKPVTTWRNRDEAFQSVARRIAEVVKVLLETQPIGKLRDRHASPLDRESNAPYILIVDDDLFASNLAQFVLAKEGYEVETTNNPRGVIQMIKRREPNLLLLDVFMPYMNGFELAERLRTEGGV